MRSKFFSVFLGMLVALAVVSFTTSLKETPLSTLPAEMPAPSETQPRKSFGTETTMVKPNGPPGVSVYVPFVVALFTALLVHKTTRGILNRESRPEHSR